MFFFSLNKVSKSKQLLFSIGLVIGMSGICYLLSGYIGYRVVAFVLLLTVSFLAVTFDITPVLVAALLSALIWDFFFIPPRFTFRVGSVEDTIMLAMYFVIAMISGVLTYKIRQIEKQARIKEEKAKSIKLYNTLFNSLSHELKTPIATIIGASDNLAENQKNLSEENKKQLIAEISMASLRLNQQVENLLNMSRLESGFIQLKKDWCDVNELIHAVVNRLEENLKRRNVHIEIEKNLPLYKLDYGLMEQVLYNLVYNASVYTPDYADIFIFAKNNDEKIYSLGPTGKEHSNIVKEMNYLVLAVEDRGNGFPPEEIEKAFDKFYRLRNTQTGGTGLGLSIVKGFVEAHHGNVELENVPHGARFTIEIPAEVSYMNNLKNEW